MHEGLQVTHTRRESSGARGINNNISFSFFLQSFSTFIVILHYQHGISLLLKYNMHSVAKDVVFNHCHGFTSVKTVRMSAFLPKTSAVNETSTAARTSPKFSFRTRMGIGDKVGDFLCFAQQHSHRLQHAPLLLSMGSERTWQCAVHRSL